MNDQVDYSTYLNKIAEEIAELTLKPEGLQAILLQGSTAKRIADAYSDIELNFLWAATTTPEERADIFQNIPSEPLFAEGEDNGEWISAFLYKGVKIDISHREMTTLQPIITDVMESRITSIASQSLMASYQDSIALYGQEALDAILKQIADYPDELSVRCIKVNALFGEWSLRNALLERQDTVALHHLVDMTLLQILRLLYALNKTYLRSYNFKWFSHHSRLLAIQPDNLEARVNGILATPSKQALDELDNLIHEVFDLVEKHHPDMTITNAKEALNYLRQPLDIKA